MSHTTAGPAAGHDAQVAEAIDEYFRSAVSALSSLPTPSGIAPPGADDPVRPGTGLTARAALDLFDDQLASRHLDLAARWLRARGQGYYTIGSSGHESNAAVAAALRPTDPALLHYRSGGFFLARARQVGGSDPVRDVLLGLVAATVEPIAGGRHKVFGRHDLAIIPQTSTIASHLPRAVGVAFATVRGARLGVAGEWPADAVTVCSFGDASANHSTAVGAINTAVHTAYQGVPMPILFVCEDNGLGISTRTPRDWIAMTYRTRPGLAYFAADGRDLAAGFDSARAAAEFVRVERRPAFLHLHTVRLMGHAGSDLESAYRTGADIAADHALDPLLGTARLLVETGLYTPAQILDRYEAVRARVLACAEEVANLPQLDSAAAVAAPIARNAAGRHAPPMFPAVDADAAALTLAQSVNRALADILASCPEALVFGEDVARKGGVYGVTRGLQKKFGATRVFDTLLDEQAILDWLSARECRGCCRFRRSSTWPTCTTPPTRSVARPPLCSSSRNAPTATRWWCASPATDTRRGSAATSTTTTQSRPCATSPASSSPPRRGPTTPRGCCAPARRRHGRVGWCACSSNRSRSTTPATSTPTATAVGWPAPDSGAPVPLGATRTYGDGTDLTVLTFGNGVPMSLRVARRLAESGISARVVDLRWLVPLPVDDIAAAANSTGRVLVVDETRRSGGVSEGVVTALVDAGFTGRVRRVASADSFVPLGDAALAVLLSETTIEAAARALVAGEE